MSTVENHQRTVFVFWGIFCVTPPVGGLGLKVLFWWAGIDLQINYNINKVSKKGTNVSQRQMSPILECVCWPNHTFYTLNEQGKLNCKSFDVKMQMVEKLNSKNDTFEN